MVKGFSINLKFLGLYLNINNRPHGRGQIGSGIRISHRKNIYLVNQNLVFENLLRPGKKTIIERLTIKFC